MWRVSWSDKVEVRVCDVMGRGVMVLYGVAGCCMVALGENVRWCGRVVGSVGVMCGGVRVWEKGRVAQLTLKEVKM